MPISLNGSQPPGGQPLLVRSSGDCNLIPGLGAGEWGLTLNVVFWNPYYYSMVCIWESRFGIRLAFGPHWDAWNAGGYGSTGDCSAGPHTQCSIHHVHWSLLISTSDIKRYDNLYLSFHHRRESSSKSPILSSVVWHYTGHQDMTST